MQIFPINDQFSQCHENISQEKRRSVTEIITLDDCQEQWPGDVLKNFAKFTGTRLCWSLFLIKLWA